MSHMLSDEDSTDSDSGIRFKTDSTRKTANDLTFRTNQNLSNKKSTTRDSHNSSHASHSRYRDYSTDRHNRSSSSSKERDRNKRFNTPERERYNRSKSSDKYSNKNSRYDKSRDSKRDNRRYSSEKNREYECRKIDYEQSSRDSRKSGTISNLRNSKEKYDTHKSNTKHSYGPVLPKKLRKNSISSNSDSEEKNYQTNRFVTQDKETYGSVLTNEISKSISISSNSDSDEHYYGPKQITKNKLNKDETSSKSNVSKLSSIKYEFPKPKSKTNFDYDNNTKNPDSILPNIKNTTKKISIEQKNETISKEFNKISSPENVSLVEENIYGPILPSKHKEEKKSDENEKYNKHPESSNKINSIQESKNISSENDSNQSKTDIFGPSLPPHLQIQPEKIENKVLGPSLPSHLREKLLEESQNLENKSIFESIPTQDSENSDDDMIGPLPEGHSSKNISHKLLEERALEMKINALNPIDTAPKREEWMTALPDVHRVNLGLGPRQFRAKEGPDLSDRSSWTDTPEDKHKKTNKEDVKIDIKEKSKLDFIAKRDKEQEEIIKKHKKKKKRDKTLIEIHQEKLAKKKKEESSMPKERRPFDRDLDLKVNRFDDAQKKAILKKAQLLDTRFSTGESKFL